MSAGGDDLLVPLTSAAALMSAMAVIRGTSAGGRGHCCTASVSVGGRLGVRCCSVGAKASAGVYGDAVISGALLAVWESFWAALRSHDSICRAN